MNLKRFLDTVEEANEALLNPGPEHEQWSIRDRLQTQLIEFRKFVANYKEPYSSWDHGMGFGSGNLENSEKDYHDGGMHFSNYFREKKLFDK